VNSFKQNPPEINNPSTGSPHSGEPVFLTVGKLKHAHGLRGEIGMAILTGFPERLVPGKKVYLGDMHTEKTIRGVRGYHKGLLIAFESIDSPEAAREHVNQFVYVRSDDLPELPPGEYYHHHLLGLAVIDEDGGILGTLVEILETGANDVYIVKKSDGSELLLPAINEVILSINLETKQIQVKPPEWT
jgi:16S rRNA processing protein RimM